MPSKSARLRRRQRKVKASVRRQIINDRKQDSREEKIAEVMLEIKQAETLLAQGKRYRRHGKIVSLDELYAELAAIPPARGEHPLLAA